MNRDYRDYPASIWDAIGDVDQGICCAALGGVVWDLLCSFSLSFFFFRQ